MPVIVWFRRDLRLDDNTALHRSATESTDGIIPVFVFDPAILSHPGTGAPIVAFMLGCLRELDASLRRRRGRLLFLHGNPVELLPALARTAHATALYYNKDYAPDAIDRDMAVERIMAKQGVTVHACKDQVIFEEQELLTASKGEPFTVYTPYRRAWEKRLASVHGSEAPARLPVPRLHFAPGLQAIEGIDLPTTESLGFTLTQTFEIRQGEAAAQEQLQAFCAGGLRHYKAHRNLPARVDSTSRLSPHLRHGTLSPRQCLAAALAARQDRAFSTGADTWIGELIWREFYQQILFNFPQVQSEPFKEKWQRVRWRESADDLERWKTGQTGFPIVDAGMRQLASTGWMHNRLRMIVAMFLTKDLLLNWQLGERHFMQNLIDGETAQNNGGWQWSAGCGTDAQPWFRIFNPVSQSQACDPDGAFIRRYCPELKDVPAEQIHAPHEMPPLFQQQIGCVIGRDYPEPMVDHAQARKRALEAFASAFGK